MLLSRGNRNVCGPHPHFLALFYISFAQDSTTAALYSPSYHFIHLTSTFGVSLWGVDISYAVQP